MSACNQSNRSNVVHRALVYDFVRFLVIVASIFALSFVQISRVYHYIRGEAIIKLYVIFNILEVRQSSCCGDSRCSGLTVCVLHRFWTSCSAPWVMICSSHSTRPCGMRHGTTSDWAATSSCVCSILISFHLLRCDTAFPSVLFSCCDLNCRTDPFSALICPDCQLQRGN